VSEVVLDASALLALMNGEPGADVVAAAMPEAVIGAVNLSEAVAKLTEAGIELADAWSAATRIARQVIAFDLDQAREAAALRSATRALGLGFGDRACLALAIVRSAPILTADRQWAKLKVGPKVHLVRP
jgi:ribonuclease VapC